MIRKDREIDKIEDIAEIISRCDVCRLGLNGDDGYPYILPLNFGYEIDSEKITLYFHSALQGKKHELIMADNRASFEMDCGHNLFSVKARGYCTMNYESVTGQGRIEYIEDEKEKERVLALMTDRYHKGEHFEYNRAALPRTSVYKLVVTAIVGKCKQSKSPTPYIAPTSPDKIPQLLEIYDKARAYMRKTGNLNQWDNGYPSRQSLERDIEAGGSYVVEIEGVPVGTFFFSIGQDPTYGQIYNGSWLDDKPYGVIHRVASDGSVKGLMKIVLDFCFSKIPNLRIDTHRDNVTMRRALVNYGFSYCGIIHLANGDERLAFQLSK